MFAGGIEKTAYMLMLKEEITIHNAGSCEKVREYLIWPVVGKRHCQC